MAVPKRVTSKARTHRRHSMNSHAQNVTLVECPHCKEQKIPHLVCAKCGYYNGKEVIKQEEKKAK